MSDCDACSMRLWICVTYFDNAIFSASFSLLHPRFSYPVVPKDQARIRVQLSAAHSQDEVQRAIDAFIKVGKEKGVIN